MHVHLANLQADAVVAAARLLKRPAYLKVACGGSAGEVARLRGVARITRWYGMRNAACVQALSAEISEELRSIGVGEDQIVPIPNGLRVGDFPTRTAQLRAEARRELDLPGSGLLVLYMGRFARYKGITDLLDVWRRRPTDEARLVLVGGEAADAPVGEIEPFDNLIVRGWTSTPLAYLLAADVFVYPSYADGMSNALLEAMAAGTAIVASRSGAAEAMIEDGVSGLLFEAGDRFLLQAQLDRVLADPDLRCTLEDEARAAAAAWDISAVVDAIEQQYLRISVAR